MIIKFKDHKLLSKLSSRDVIVLVETITSSKRFSKNAPPEGYTVLVKNFSSSNIDEFGLLQIKIKLTLYGNPDLDHGIDYNYTCHRTKNWSEHSTNLIKTRP